MKCNFLKFLFIEAFFGIFLYGCNKNPFCSTKTGDQGIIIKNYTSHEDCIYSKKREFLIRNDSELKSTIYIESFPICDSVRLPEIDFSKYSIMGLGAGTNSGGGYLRTILRNDAKKKVIYQIYANTCTYNKVDFSSSNMVIIPKVPDDYTAEFILKED
ncbi:MAG: hypothetical protein EOP53_00265 [Sphingobacteriales bacterium]|nr:MAG: hypothetical protein EOP53_00265 [Sphingobacteriales bacterium]